MNLKETLSQVNNNLIKKSVDFFADNDIISLVVSKTKITNPIWNAEVSELADEQD
mgnify:FL=1